MIGTESSARMWSLACARLLQWGRALIGTESRALPEPDKRIQSFNGAVP